VKEPAVANSTPVIGLQRIGRLDILQELFATIYIPPKVQEEIGITIDWIKVQAPSNQILVDVLKIVVDEGEAEAIGLALEKGLRLIIDDRKARIYAKRLGVKVIGTAGILVRAKKVGIIPSVKSLLEALKQKGFYLSSELIAEVLRLVGEE